MTARNLLFLATAVLLAGCWTPPVSTVQPNGPPRLIQRGLLVESEMRPAVVQSVETRDRMIVLQASGETSAEAYRADPKVSGLDRIHAGEKVHVSFLEELTIYVSREGRGPAADGATQSLVASAKVLSVDPSYRLLTVEYPDGWKETLKVGQDARLGEMEAGDDVAIRRLELVRVAARKPWWR